MYGLRIFDGKVHLKTHIHTYRRKEFHVLSVGPGAFFKCCIPKGKKRCCNGTVRLENDEITIFLYAYTHCALINNNTCVNK